MIGEVKSTQEAVLRMQQGLNQIKGTQEHQGLGTENVKSQLRKIEDDLTKLSTTLKGPLPALDEVPPWMQDLCALNTEARGQTAAQGQAGPQCRTRDSERVGEPQTSPNPIPIPQIDPTV